MLNLDLRTIIFMSGILAALLSLVMLLVRLSYPRTLGGLGYWILAPLLVSVSTFLFGMRGQIPDLVSIVGANMMLVEGILLIHFGSQLFFGLRPGYRFWYPLLGAMLPVLVWFTLYEPSFNVRVQLVCLVWISILLANARVVWRNGAENFATRFTVVAMITHAMVISLRLLATLLPLPDEGLLTPTRVQTLYIGANALMIIAITVGLVMLAAERLRSEFEHLATRDSLTGALTRRVLIEACEHELARCRRHGRSLALLVMDIDHFKAVNDTHGHQMGDRVLVDFVNRVSALLRRPDLLARFGGEGFVVLLHETGLEEAQAVAGRILARIAEPVAGLPSVTVSIGVTVNRPDEEQIDPLLARADRALYKAKEGGRNRVAVV
jgi:diguanylate cyclase (GGDEF)-like protein